tara:strand:- start:1655 stop:1933 length:279 start_codon:yes stop_codon:yes gene_type:complete
MNAEINVAFLKHLVGGELYKLVMLDEDSTPTNLSLSVTSSSTDLSLTSSSSFDEDVRSSTELAYYDNLRTTQKKKKKYARLSAAACKALGHV